MRSKEQILAAIVELEDETGWHPTVRQVAAKVGYRRHSAAVWHIARLIDEGLVVKNATGTQMRATMAGRLSLDWEPIPYLPTAKARG